MASKFTKSRIGAMMENWGGGGGAVMRKRVMADSYSQSGAGGGGDQKQKLLQIDSAVKKYLITQPLRHV